MTRFVSLLTGLLLTTGAAHAQWVNQPLAFATPAALPINLDVVDASTVWVASTTFDLATYVTPELARTTDGGQTWTVRALPVRVAQSEVVEGLSAISATEAWMVTVPLDSAGSRILHTVDGGQRWQVQGSGSAFPSGDSFATFVHFYSPLEGLVGGHQLTTTGGIEVYRTTDGGLSWSAIPMPPMLADEDIANPRPLVVLGNSLWLASDEGRVFRSVDRGLTWAVSQVPNAFDLRGLAFRDAQNGLLTGATGTGNTPALYRTSDGGQTWTPVSYSGPLPGIGLAPVPGTGNYLATGGNLGNGGQGSSYSRDNGQTWVALENTVNHLYAELVSPTVGWSMGFQVVNNRLVGNGVNKLTTTTLSTRANKALQASVQVVPNPVEAGQTTLQATQPLHSPAQVRVLDATGRLVKKYTWAGSTPLPLDLSGQGTGLYLVEVESAQGLVHHKVLVR